MTACWMDEVGYSLIRVKHMLESLREMFLRKLKDKKRRKYAELKSTK